MNQEQSRGCGCIVAVLLILTLCFLFRDAIWGRDGLFDSLSQMLR